MHRNETDEIGSQLGYDAVERVAQHAEEYSEYERQRIALTNEARINALQIEGAYLVSREREVIERMRHTDPAGNRNQQRATARYYWIAAGILTTAAFFFSLVAFDPYRLGWIGDLYCLGIAVVTPFAVEEFLQAWNSDKVFQAVVTVVFISALLGGAFLAAIRGDLLARQVEQSASPTVTIDDASAAPPQTESTFYESTRSSLRLLMLFLAIAIDLGAGVAVHRARATGISLGEDYGKLAHELEEIRRQLGAVIYEITALTNAPTIFVARFWRDFYRAMITQTTRKALTKWFGIVICLILLGAGSASAQTPLHLVVAVDLSTSENANGHDQVSQFNKNINGVKRVLASAEAGSRITVIGITENSFADPYVLLRADVSPDSGYFGERLATARRHLVLSWHDRASHLAPTAKGTDILGAIRLAGELFRNGPQNSRKVLLLYSDMRHVTPQLNLEKSVIPVDKTLSVVQKQNLMTDLTGVTIDVLGADADGRQVAEWESLKTFWTKYFQRAGANLGGYSMLTDPPGSGY